MTENKFWWASGEEGNNPGPDPGPDVPINQSLRFRGNQTLTGPTVSSSTFTVSYWLKIGGPMNVTEGGDYYHWHAGTDSSDTGTMVYVNYNTNASTTGQFSLVAATNTPTSVGKFRDPSAWYHVVVNRDDTNTTMWVNGEQQIAPVAGNALSSEFFIGHGHGGAAANNFKGYMADWYFIDGQALEPTAFGRFNDAEVWVPREVDFTPAEMRFSDFVTTADGGGWFQDRTPERMFNPSTTSAEGETMVNDNGDAIVFRPVPAINFTSSVEVFTNMSNGAGTIFFNDPDESGTGTDTVVASWQTIATGSGTLEEILVRSGTERANCSGIRVDGEQLLNPFLWSAGMASNPASPGLDYLPAANRVATDNPGNAFDGNDATFCSTPGQQKRIYWTAPTQLENVTTLRVNNNTGQMQNLFINGTDTGFTSTTGPGWIDISAQIPADGIITEISFHTSVSNNTTRIAAIEVNGQVLQDGVNSSYGANGFHLDFSDPDDIGADRSGNGNDFTPTGFDTAPVGIFSNDLTCAPGNFNAASPATTAFDGDDTTFAEGTNTGDVLTFAPVPGIAYNSLEIAVRNDDQLFSLNGGANTSIANNRTTPTFVEIDSTPGTLDTLVIEGAAGEPGSLWGIRINGTTVLVDNTGEDYDLMQDSPTQNYATLNPLDPFASTTIDANLGITAGAAREFAPGTIAMADNRFYVELNCDQPPVNPPNRQYIVYIVPSSGVDNSTPSLSTGVYEVKVSSGTDFEIETNNVPVVAGTLPSAPGANFTMQVLYNAGTRELYCGIDNANWLRNDGTISTAFDESEPTIVLPEPASGSYTIGCNIYNGTGNINYGQQQPFIYTPPAGFEALQTANLPAAPIADGRDHFQAITGPGSGVAAGTFPNQLNGGWARFLTAPGGFVASPNDQSAAFSDADVSSIAADPNVILTFEPDTPIAFTTHFRFASNHSAESPGEFSFNGGPWTAINHDFSGHTRADYATNGQTIATGPGQLESFRIRRLENADQPAIFWMQIDDDIMVDSGILRVAQQIFPNGLWWIKDRVNPNQHQLVDSVRGGNLSWQTPAGSSVERPYVAPAGNSVAWCWNAGGAAVTNNDGSLESQVSANTDAGFSIVSYTGNTSSNQTIGHGLTEPPEMVFTQNLDLDRWCAVYHDYLPLSGENTLQFLILGDAGAAINAGGVNGMWADTRPDENVFHVGTTDNHSNGNGNRMIAYCWQSVPGYSAFGSYTANGDDDGVFVYTGFSVAWLMCKRVGSSGDWVILDTTRGPVNPNNLWLQPNSTSEETAPAIGVVDLLSNGFKHRSASAQLNNSGDYIYCAFASNPFQAPVTAR